MLTAPRRIFLSRCVQSVDGVLSNATYSHTKVKQWTSMVRMRKIPATAFS